MHDNFNMSDWYISNIILTENQTVSEAYDEIIGLLRKHARSMNDDDAYELHEKLKSFFNKSI